MKLRVLSSILLALTSSVLLQGSLFGCGTRDGVVVVPADPPRLDRPDSTSMQECAWPTMVKLSLLTKDQLEDLLRGNALHQIDCYRKHHNLIRYITTRDDALTGAASARK